MVCTTIKITSCIPNWQCEIPLNGYEHDINNCGQSRRLKSSCNATCTNVPIYGIWTVCQSNNKRTRTVTNSCTGAVTTESQTCTYIPPSNGDGNGDENEDSNGLCDQLGLDDQTCSALKYVGIGIGALIVGYTVYKVLPKNK